VAAGGTPLAGLALIAPPVGIPGWERPSLLSVDGPVLVVAGSRDTYFPREALATLAAALPGATVRMIDGADHFFFAGLEALEAALADWASKLTRGAGGLDAR
jgi:pimeloyl-ACP methyl ester carboxylesterase